MRVVAQLAPQAATAERLGVTLPDLMKLRRVTAGSIIQAGLLVFAGYALFTVFSSVDYASVSDELRNMTVGAVIIGFVLLGVGGLLGAEWEEREIDKYLRRTKYRQRA